MHVCLVRPTTVEAAVAGGLPATLDTNAQLKLIFRYYCRFGRTTGNAEKLRASQHTRGRTAGALKAVTCLLAVSCAARRGVCCLALKL